jgi:hypothetical protein
MVRALFLALGFFFDDAAYGAFSLHHQLVRSILPLRAKKYQPSIMPFEILSEIVDTLSTNSQS